MMKIRLKIQTFSQCPALPDPICYVADEVKEEIALGNADDLVRQLDKQAEPLGRLHAQSL